MEGELDESIFKKGGLMIIKKRVDEEDFKQ